MISAIRSHVTSLPATYRLAAGLLLLAAVGVLAADERPTGGEQPPVAAAGTPPAVEGDISAVTAPGDTARAWVPLPPELIEELQRELDASRGAPADERPSIPDGTAVEKLADGTERAYLPASLLSVTSVRNEGDGHLVTLPCDTGSGAPAAVQVHATLAADPVRLQGAAADGRVLLYAIDPVEAGSSISHWDSSADPDLLMEPALSPNLGYLELDITPAQMQDIGWRLGSTHLNLVDRNEEGVGFSDPQPFAGAPGNPATTLGEARRNLFAAVFDAWGRILDSPVDIDVLVTFRPLPCQEGQGATLASAGSNVVLRDNPSFPHQGVWYHAALAESFAGSDLSGPADDGGGDIVVFVNSNIDEGCLGEGTGFYYGLDGNSPANQLDLSTVVLHELAHGLGMSNFTDEETGELLQRTPGIYDLFTLDTGSGRTWDEMTDEERAASAVNFRQVVWSGPSVTAAAAALLRPGMPRLVIDSPAAIAGTYEVGQADFGPPPDEAGVTAEIVCLVDEEADASYYNGCTAASNAGALDGKIALIDRGDCTFVQKAQLAQAAGAAAVVIINRQGSPLTLGGADPSITIPVVSLGRADGRRIRLALCPESVPRPAPRRPSGRL